MKKIDDLSVDQIRVMCAEVMGAKWYTFASGQRWLSFKPLADHFRLSSRPEDFEMTTIHEGVPNYPESADAALTLCAWMTKFEHGYQWESYGNGNGKVYFRFYNPSIPGATAAKFTAADALPLAICRAFLIANRLAE